MTIYRFRNPSTGALEFETADADEATAYLEDPFFLSNGQPTEPLIYETYAADGLTLISAQYVGQLDSRLHVLN